MFCEVLKYFPMFIMAYYIPIPSVKMFAFATLLFWCAVKVIQYYKSLPPGPWGVPLLGYLPFMPSKPPHQLYKDLAGRYGDVFSVQLGSNLVVGISCQKLVRDLFNRPDSTGRPKTPLNSLLGGLGIITSEGSLWKRQRTFLHEKFRSLGVRMYPDERFEKYVICELEELFTTLNEGKGKALDPNLILGRHVHNVICQLMMSFRFERDDYEFVLFNKKVSRGMKLYGMVHMGEHFKPYLHLPGKQAVIQEIQRNLRDVSKFHADHVAQRVKERAGSSVYSEPADLLDCYIDKVYNENKDVESKNQIFPGVNPVDQIIQTMNDLFSAGMETTLTTLLWSMVMMIREPQVAEKVREELRKHVAPRQLVTMKHRLDMPYIEGVVFETMRMASIVPLGTIHVNETDWHVGGHTIPAGSHIMALLNKMNMDPDIYPEPEKFMPERFIKDGKCSAANFLQFGVGQRMCLGNMLARLELFLFFANIMNTYEFYIPEGAPVPGLEGVLGATHTPSPYKLIFKKQEE